MAAKIFRINYKSDFILTLNSDAGWMTPFCIKFWTGAPSQAYFVGWDGTTYTHCAFDPSEPTKLLVQFDDHHLPIGELKFQIAYHFTVADFPNDTEDEVINPASITTEIDGETYQVMLDFTGETAPEIEFSLPAYANEAQRIANEQQRIAHESIRIVNEESRIAAETIRQQNEAQRIAQETARVNEFATLKSQSQAATRNANDAATLANQKAQLAQDKADLAQAAATLANQNAQLAADKAALANAAAQLANEKAALAQQKAEYAQTQGGYAKDQGDYAKDQGDYAKAQGDTALADHQRAEADHGIAVDDHTQAGNDHTRAESDHTQAGNDHTRAESDHTQAGNDHTQAGNDHTRAESDHTQAGNDHTRAESDHTRAESDHAAVEVYVDSLGAFDISAYHATGGVLAEYADLTAALGTNGANIPDALRKGGMSVKFVQSSDNKYVQYRLISPTWSTAEANWQGVDSEPIAGSENLVKSGGVENSIHPIQCLMKRTINLYDYTRSVIGYVKNNGTIVSYSSFKASDYIPVTAGTTYKIKDFGSYNYRFRDRCFYDENKNMISGSYASSIVYEVTAPNNAAYLRFSISGGSLDDSTIVVFTGDLPTEYIPYYLTDMAYIPAKIVINNNIGGFNLLIGNVLKKAINAGYQFKGIVTPSSVIPSTIDDKIFYIGFNGRYSNLGEVVVVENGEIAFFLYDSSWNASVIKFNIAFSNLDNTIVESINMFNKDTITENAYIKNNGTVLTGQNNWWCSDFIPVVGGSKFSISYGRDYSFYGISKNHISHSTSNLLNATLTVPENAAYFRFSGYNRSTDDVMMNKGETVLPYQSYKLQFKKELIPYEEPEVETIDISLPSKVYAVVGDTLQIYYRSIVRAASPYIHNILLSCGRGKQLPRFFEHTPSSGDTGTFTLGVSLRNNELESIGNKSCSLSIVGAGNSPSSNKNIVCVGDSLTKSGQWVTELSRRLTGTGGTPEGRGMTNISFVGAMGSGNAKYFGCGGWSWGDYATQGRTCYRFYVSGVTSIPHNSTYTNNGSTFTVIEVNITSGTGYILCERRYGDTNEPEASGTLTRTFGAGDATVSYSSYETTPGNPFWNNGALTFIPYANTYCNGTIDAIYIMLGANGLTPNKTDFSSTIALIKTFADTLHSEFPNAKLKLMGTAAISFNGGAGENEGASGLSYANQMGIFYAMLNYNEMCQAIANESNYSSFVEYVDVISQVDCENNMPRSEFPVNTRNPETEYRDTNEMHPSIYGYYQIADVAYRNIIASFCQ